MNIIRAYVNDPIIMSINPLVKSPPNAIHGQAIGSIVLKLKKYFEID